MNQSLHSELFRVTSIPYSSSSYVIFSGIPLNDETNQIKDGKYYVTIKARPETLPAQPSQGQLRIPTHGDRSITFMPITQ